LLNGAPTSDIRRKTTPRIKKRKQKQNKKKNMSTTSVTESYLLTPEQKSHRLWRNIGIALLVIAILILVGLLIWWIVMQYCGVNSLVVHQSDPNNIVFVWQGGNAPYAYNLTRPGLAPGSPDISVLAGTSQTAGLLVPRNLFVQGVQYTFKVTSNPTVSTNGCNASTQATFVYQAAPPTSM
jgi:hypothetical protein